MFPRWPLPFFLTVSGVVLASQLATAQVTLFSDDFEDGNLDGWTIGSTGCAAEPNGWSVEGGKLIYQQTSCGECSVLHVGDASWGNYAASFDVRVIGGDRFRVAVAYVDESSHLNLTVSDRAAERDASVYRAPGLLVIGGDPFSWPASWTSFEIQLYDTFIGVATEGTNRFGNNTTTGSGGFAIYAPESLACGARLEIDNVVIRKPLPYGELGSWNQPDALGTPYDLRTLTQYTTSAVIQPIGASVHNWLTRTTTSIPGPTWFTLEVANDVGSASIPFLAVPGAPLVYEFASTPNPVVLGGSATTTWNASGGDSVEIQPGNLSFPGHQGSTQLSPTQSTQYTLSVIADGQTVATRNHTLQVVPLQILDLTTDRNFILPGSLATLSWSANAADLVTIEPGGYSSTAAAGTFDVTPLETTEYVLTCSFAGQQVQSSIQIEVESSRIRSFQAAAPAILPGGSTNLVWDASYGDLLEIDPIGFQTAEMAGSIPVSPSTSTLYTLRLHNGEASVEKQVQVNVHDLAIEVARLSHSTQSLGGPIEITWDVRPPDTDVFLDGQGPWPASGSQLRYPLVSGSVEVLATIDGLSVQASLSYAVEDPAPTAENLLLVSDPVTLVPYVENPGLGVPFDVYAVAVGPLDPVSGFGFRMELPPCLVLMSAEYPPGFQLLSAAPDHFGFYGGLLPCVAADEVVELARFTLIAFQSGPNDCIGDPHLVMPTPPLNPIAETGLQSCPTDEWTPFGEFRGIWIGGGPLAITAVAPEVETPRTDVILGNQPNPFNPATTLHFHVAAPGPAQIRILDASGRAVLTTHLDLAHAGPQTFRWDGRDQRGTPVASGVYLAELRTPQGSSRHKMALLK